MTKEELEKLKQTVEYFGHWYDVIGEERIVILEKSIDYIDDLEKEKCELLGIIQGKDKAIKDLKEDNKVMADNYSRMERWFYNNFAEAKEIMQNLLDVAKFYSVYRDKSALMDVTPIYEAEEFLKEKL